MLQPLGSPREVLDKLISLVRLREELEPEVVEEQRQVLLNRTVVVGGIGLIVIPFTIITYLAELSPESATPSTGALISLAADLSILLLVLAIRRGAFPNLYHLPMFILLGLICGITEAVMLQLTGGGSKSLFFFPYYLIYFGLATLFPGRLGWIALTSASLVVTYATSEAIGGHTERSQVVANIIQLIDYSLITCIGNRVITKLFVRERHGRLQLERANERLKEVDRLKTEFFANVNHELRTPLTLVMAPIASILRGEQGSIDAGQRRMLETVQRSASRLLALINDLLLLSRLGAGKVDRRYDMVDVAEICDRVVAAFGPYAAQLHLEIEWNHPMWQCHWCGDPSHLERALINLLSNACKFSREGGRIRISVEADGQDFVVSVEDQGIGIAEKDLGRVFKRFEQVESAPNRRFEGSGIGLAIVQELTQFYGGSVAVKSELGKGSTFTIKMPGASKDDADAPGEISNLELAMKSEETISAELDRMVAGVVPMAPVTPESTGETPLIRPSGPEGQPLVMVVEDNVELLSYLEHQLSKDLRILAFSDSRAALKHALTTPPDLVLSDIMMPYLDGLDLAKRIRANKASEGVPIVLLSARHDLDTKLTGFAQGVDDFVQKPFQLPELKARIQLHLQLRAQAKELERAYSKLKASEAHIIQSEKVAALGTVVAGVAHEINNPLHFIRGNIGVLKKSFARLASSSSMSQDVKGEITSIFEDLESSLQRISAITRELYMFTRRDANAHDAVNLDSLIDIVIKVLGTQVKPGVRVIKKIGEPKVIQSNPQALFQVLMNLVQNAIHAVGERGEISVENGLENGHVLLNVRDTGCGIAPENLSRIFEPFFTTKPVGQGTGLGLSIVQNLVGQIKGEIRVKSALDNGTVFTIELPREGPSA
jgi:signal transduction histidine kinase